MKNTNIHLMVESNSRLGLGTTYDYMRTRTGFILNLSGTLKGKLGVKTWLTGGGSWFVTSRIVRLNDEPFNLTPLEFQNEEHPAL